MSGIYNIEHYVMTCQFSNLEQGVIFLSFNRHCFTMNLVKEKQGD